jgi:hypothetical protein
MTTTTIRGTRPWLGSKRRSERTIDPAVFGKKLGVITALFGCWHDNLSRPFVTGKTAYRSCLGCGARRQFDPETLITHGGFYSTPKQKLY